MKRVEDLASIDAELDAIRAMPPGQERADRLFALQRRWRLFKDGLERVHAEASPPYLDRDPLYWAFAGLITDDTAAAVVLEIVNDRLKTMAGPLYSDQRASVTIAPSVLARLHAIILDPKIAIGKYDEVAGVFETLCAQLATDAMRTDGIAADCRVLALLLRAVAAWILCQVEHEESEIDFDNLPS